MKNGPCFSITYPGNKKVSYTYDAANQMKTVRDWSARVTSYEYDNNGNLTKTTRPGGSILTKTYDNANRVAAITDKTSGGAVINNYTYSYNAAGNMLTENSTGSLSRMLK